MVITGGNKYFMTFEKMLTAENLCMCIVWFHLVSCRDVKMKINTTQMNLTSCAAQGLSQPLVSQTIGIIM